MSTAPDPSTEDPVMVPNKQQIRSKRSTNALLEAAAELIVEGGFAALTFASIGERSGYSRGLATARFGSKDGLVDALIDRIVSQWSTRKVLPRTTEQTGGQAMLTVIESIRDQARNEPRHLRVLYALAFESLGTNDELRLRMVKLHDDMRSNFTAILRRGVRDGTVADRIVPELEADFLIAGLRGVGFQWLLSPDRFDPVAALDYLIETTRVRLAP